MKGKTTKFILGIILPAMLVMSLGLVAAAPVFAAALTNVTDTPTDDAAGATATHTVGFTTATELPKLGQMRFAFPPGFNVSGATLGAVTGPDGNFTLTKSGQVITVSRNGDGAAFAAGAVTVALNNIVNHQIAADTYTVDVDTTDAFGVRLDGPTASDAFEIVPADLANLVVVDQPPQTVAGVEIADVTVRAEDAFGNVIENVNVDVTAVGFGFTGGTPTQLTDATGIATFDDLKTNTAGTGYVLRFSDDATGLITGDSDAFDVIPAALDALVVVDQPTDPTTAGVAIGPVTVQALDQFGNPRAGDAIDVEEKGGYTFDAGTLQQTTDATGIATFGDLKIDTADTGYQLTFSSGGGFDVDSDPFDVVAAGLAELDVLAQPVETVAGDPIAAAGGPVLVQAFDEFDNPIAGVDVNVAEAGGYIFDAGTLQQTTDATGIATFDNLVINTADTGYVLRFSDDDTGLITEDSDAFNVIPDALATLTIQVQPTQTVAGDPISPAVTVLAQDQFGNPIEGVAVDVEEVGAEPLVGTLQRATLATGIATFDDLKINNAGTGYQLEFYDDVTELITDTSDLFDVVALDLLIITNEPTDPITAGVAIHSAVPGPVTVEARDTLGAPISGIIVDVTLNKGAFAGGTLQQTTDVDGIATFGDLVITTADTDYGLHFASGGKTDDSALFDVVPAAVETLTVEVQPTDAGAGAVIAPAVQVKAVDEFNNLIGGLPIDVTLLVGTGTLSGTPTQVTAASGIATFDDLSIDLPGVKQLQFAADGETVDSDAFNVGTEKVDLAEDWNLMSSPLIPNDTDIEDVLADIEADVLSVWYYDAVSNDWLIYSPPAFNTLTTIEDGKAYWIDMDDEATLWIDGRELPAPPGLPPVYDVVAGWNMVGFKSTVDMSAVDYLNAMAGKYTRIYGFVQGAWFTIPPPAYAVPQMIPGLGYWVSFTEDGAIYP